LILNSERSVFSITVENNKNKYVISSYVIRTFDFIEIDLGSRKRFAKNLNVM
jgi:hypothetical protein